MNSNDKITDSLLDKFRPYQAPRLTRFGSVRNLTGGSGAQGSDGGTTMTMMA